MSRKLEPYLPGPFEDASLDIIKRMPDRKEHEYGGARWVYLIEHHCCGRQETMTHNTIRYRSRGKASRCRCCAGTYANTTREPHEKAVRPLELMPAPIWPVPPCLEDT